MPDVKGAPLSGKLEIHVLGDLIVARDGDPLALPPSKKTRALLVYLACTGRPQRRERLCELFWDVPDDPRGALRWSLSKIRHVLDADGDYLQADRQVVSLSTDTIFLDCAAVRSLTRHELAHASTEELEHLAGLFRGRFIDNLSLPRCPGFEAWRLATAEEMEQAQLRILRCLVERLADDQLGRIGSRALLDSILGSGESLKELKRILLARAEGTPLFLEEWARNRPQGARDDVSR